MAVAPGTRLGPYEIVAPLGAGGMGEVYKARDTRLDRTVAIKVLAPSLAADLEFKERFDREARTISQLNHPHICTLHDIGHHAATEGQPATDYLVLEYLEGETLAERIAKGPLALAEALRIATEICDALDRAHAAGVVHRDLKPANVMLTKSGAGSTSSPQAKLLDFGLAKAATVSSGPRGAMTMTTPLTSQGTILGTFQYMAPEQIEGKEADARSDVWAFGCVLYEMITGTRAFEGKSQASLMASILKEAPRPIADLIAVPPAALDRVIRTCLAKDPDARWQSVRDLGRELEWIATAPPTPPAGPSQRRSSRAVLWPIAAFAAGAALVATAWTLRSSGRPTASGRPAVEFNIAVHPSDTMPVSVAVSPDETAVAYTAKRESAGDRMLWIRRFADAEPRAIEGTSGASWPFWNPNGAEIGYFADEKVWAVGVSGGKPRPICDSKYGVGAAWSARGPIIFSSAFVTGLSRVDPSSGKVETLTTLDATRRESLHGWPVFLPGGDRFLFLSRTIASETSRIEIGSMDGRHTAVTDADALVGYANRRVFFVRNGILWSQPFDPEAGVVSGQPASVVDGVRFSESWAVAGASVGEQALAYLPFEPVTVVASWFDPTGARIRDAFEDRDSDGPRISPDGARVSVERFDPARGAGDLWVYDLARGTRNRLTATREDEDAGPWSPDGRHIYYSSDATGPYAILKRDADGLTPAESMVSVPATDWQPRDLSPDGKWLIVSDSPASDLWMVPVDDPGKRTKWLATEFDEDHARFSPDGRWLTFEWNRSGAFEVYARAFEGGTPVVISTGGGTMARWSPDGRTIYYVATGGKVMAVPIALSDRLLVPSPARLVLVDPNIRALEVAPDGRLFIMTRTGVNTIPLRVRVGLH